MNQQTLFHSVLIQTDDTGAIVNVMRANKTALFDGEGNRVTPWALEPPTDIDAPLATEILGEIHAGLLTGMADRTAALASAEARIADLETALAAKVARINELEVALTGGLAEIETLTSRIADLTKPPTPATLAFRALPQEIQDAFEDSYKIAAVLVDAGRPDLARAHIAALAVPDELEETRQGILALIV